MRYDFGLPLLGRWSGHCSFLHSLALLISSFIYTVCLQHIILTCHCITVCIVQLLYYCCLHAIQTHLVWKTLNKLNLPLWEWCWESVHYVESTIIQSICMHGRVWNAWILTSALSFSTGHGCAAAQLLICTLTNCRAMSSGLHSRGSTAGQFWPLDNLFDQKRLWSWEHALWFLPTGNHVDFDAEIYPCFGTTQ